MFLFMNNLRSHNLHLSEGFSVSYHSSPKILELNLKFLLHRVIINVGPLHFHPRIRKFYT
ncbi:hypothetical protein LEP1GSC062_1501 [Leptospira alexanderi serovar Manhao 3 str. L 60]|uniref:Uncharacterized protein n=1 Tax=Leptospira alexanderi serovar Manhao 3 str. L 60 TaxID=1049759 RepID=V6HWD7_9LEPT|nr:hypothetical protein LEP1GSC062_1501 [Leptospira alexanderi serovar Manhao 3 str. L 60]